MFFILTALTTCNLPLTKSSNNAVISRADVAKLTVAAIDDKRTYKTAFNIYSGSESIGQVFDQLGEGENDEFND